MIYIISGRVTHSWPTIRKWLIYSIIIILSAKISLEEKLKDDRLEQTLSNVVQKIHKRTDDYVVIQWKHAAELLM